MTKTISANKASRVLNVLPDPPDIRDWPFRASLKPLAPSIAPPGNRNPLDQGREGACTGFGLAAVINQLLRRQERAEQGVSPRMLYEMARRHDEWPGENYAGSSCRGAIRGWKNMGVCTEASWPYEVGANADDKLTIERAFEARRITVGAYYRLATEVVDYHAAINEAGAVFCSANVHNGWQAPVVRGRGTRKTATIEYSSESIGGHAFALVGYDYDGFWVQNSWGNDWGVNGVALWLYEDWLENVSDGWVVQLALPTPQIFGYQPGARRSPSGELPADNDAQEIFRRAAPKRIEIAGHFVHFDDGRFKTKGDYWSNQLDVEHSAERVASSNNYDNFLIYAHGGLNNPKASARRVRALKEGFKRNRVYPFHLMYDTGLGEEIKDVVKRGLFSAENRAGGFSDWTDNLIEAGVRKPGTAIWEEMKRDARDPFVNEGDGLTSIRAFAERFQQTPIEIHMAGHSTGAIVLGHLLNGLDALELKVRIKTMTLFAPAARVDFFKEKYVPYLNGSAKHVSIGQLVVYNLNDDLERDDNVALAYRKSLLYMVSRAFERDEEVPLLGMEKYSKRLHRTPRSKFIYSDGGKSKQSRSTSHGGFDNDLTTMNHMLKRIIGAGPISHFTEDEMIGF